GGPPLLSVDSGRATSSGDPTMPTQSTSSETQGSNQAPAIRAFQFDSSALGGIAKSGNLYRGAVNLPLTPVNLPGPNGLDLTLTAFYSSNVTTAVDTWNREAPTSVLGLGWSLPFSKIAFLFDESATGSSGTYVLYQNDSPVELIAVDATRAGEIVFACRDF